MLEMTPVLRAQWDAALEGGPPLDRVLYAQKANSGLVRCVRTARITTDLAKMRYRSPEERVRFLASGPVSDRSWEQLVERHRVYRINRYSMRPDLELMQEIQDLRERREGSIWWNDHLDDVAVTRSAVLYVLKPFGVEEAHLEFLIRKGLLWVFYTDRMRRRFPQSYLRRFVQRLESGEIVLKFPSEGISYP